MPSRRDVVGCWVVGLALGVWIGTHAHTRVRALPLLDGLVGVALVLGSLLLLAAAPASRRR